MENLFHARARDGAANTGIGKVFDTSSRGSSRARARLASSWRAATDLHIARRWLLETSVDDTGNRDVECRLLDLAEFASVRAFAEGSRPAR